MKKANTTTMDPLIEGYFSYLDKVGRKTPRTIVDVPEGVRPARMRGQSDCRVSGVEPIGELLADVAPRELSKCMEVRGPGAPGFEPRRRHPRFACQQTRPVRHT